MYTSLVLFALTGFSSAAETVSPSWLIDYDQARKQGVTDKKPVAVFVASGKEGWDKLVRGGVLGMEQKKILEASYVCLYVDSTTEEGKRLAQSLSIGKGIGLVISDQSGKYMAFHHEGDLEAKALTGYLQKYADPNRVVYRTDTNPGPETRQQTRSYYYAPAAPVRVYSGRSC